MITEIDGADLEQVFAMVRARLRPLVTDAQIWEELRTGGVLEPLLLAFAPQQHKYCIRCGECCRTQTPILLSKRDLKTISRHTGIGISSLIRRLHIKREKNSTFAMRGRPCPFLHEDLCSIYAIRPLVCRAYPTGALMVGQRAPLCPVTRELQAQACITNILQKMTPDSVREELQHRTARLSPEEWLNSLRREAFRSFSPEHDREESAGP